MAAKSKTRLVVRHPGGKYEVVIGSHLLPELRELAGVDGPVIVITDSNVGPLYAHLTEATYPVITFPAGEVNKTLATVRSVYDQMLDTGIDRTATVVALGGGVVGDVAGFVAATYMRGISFVQCPTSLLAMVDASVGGKTGVDLPQGKNVVGAFKQPAAVLADLSTLETLPAPEFAAGMAEVVKHGLIASPQLLAQIESGDWLRVAWESSHSADLESLITVAIRVKRVVVQEDPFESGRRAVLNLGHTFGHAIERLSNYAIRHGEAVAMGLVAAARLSASLTYCRADLQKRIENVLHQLSLPTRIPRRFQPDAILRAMNSDKKKAAGSLRFVLLRDVGDVFVASDVPETAVLETLVALSE
jgi:3-dehydroquinate synthase